MALGDTEVEYLQVYLTIGDAKKDKDTPVRMRVFGPSGTLMVREHWAGDSGVKIQGDWFGSGTTWYPGPMSPWTNHFDTWRATQGRSPLLKELKDGYVEVEVGGSDHFNFSATIEAKLVGLPTRMVLNSDRSVQRIASDGDRGKGPSRQIRLDLI